MIYNNNYNRICMILIMASIRETLTARWNSDHRLVSDIQAFAMWTHNTVISSFISSYSYVKMTINTTGTGSSHTNVTKAKDTYVSLQQWDYFISINAYRYTINCWLPSYISVVISYSAHKRSSYMIYACICMHIRTDWLLTGPVSDH